MILRPSVLAIGVAALGIGSCLQSDRFAAGAVTEARARISDTSGRQVAIASLRETDGLHVRVEVVGLPRGTYGTHIHAVGRCELPSFSSAGSHWNASTRQHGSLNPLGAHLGDLPNLSVGADGRGTIEFSIEGALLHRGEQRLMDSDGAALVIHAGPDDYRTDPSGNSGARIACGVLG